jgi:hypothetical protein
MYVTLRRYGEIGARMYEMIARKIEEGLVPTLKAQPGFLSYCAFMSEDGDGVSVTVFDDRAQAMRANEQVHEWVVSKLKDLVADPPEVLSGEALLHDVSKQRSGGTDMFAAVRVYGCTGVAPSGGRAGKR